MPSSITNTAFDALLPADMAAKAVDVGAAKARMPALRLFVLAILGGAFIGIGAAFSTTTAAGAQELPYGVARLLAGISFSLGLLLIVVGGAELFTGNNLLAMAWASGRVSTALLLRNWLVVYVGNFAGAVATAWLVFQSGQYAFGEGIVGTTAIRLALAKCSLAPGEAFVLGILCNALVCLAVWLCYSARSTADKVLCIVPPITAFVACGFEHSIANMYFVPLALLVQGMEPPTAASLGVHSEQLTVLSWSTFLWRNLLPVTLGNIVGGSLMVGIVYWFVYLRPSGRIEMPGTRADQRPARGGPAESGAESGLTRRNVPSATPAGEGNS